MYSFIKFLKFSYQVSNIFLPTPFFQTFHYTDIWPLKFVPQIIDHSLIYFSVFFLWLISDSFCYRSFSSLSGVNPIQCIFQFTYCIIYFKYSIWVSFLPSIALLNLLIFFSLLSHTYEMCWIILSNKSVISRSASMDWFFPSICVIFSKFFACLAILIGC